ncbi:MAG TPA: TetR/AcrR family transcriptional regulator [Hyphomonadaceae bacterium]|nr:TetR/AcrR family transcriptional regulator [Hyphomonadaceae bacterium]
MTTTLSTDRPKRRTNPERAAETRHQVMDAVITILNQKGFCALTNALIIADTGISSGALMHHFHTRQQLLVATVEYAYANLVAFRKEQLEQLPAGLPRFRAMIDLHWHSAQLPAGFAVNEMRIGARSDPDLAAVFRPVFTRIANEYAHFVADLVREAGLKPDQEMEGLWTATSMAMRSLAIDLKTYASPNVALSTRLALRTLRETLIARQLGPVAAQDPRIEWEPASAAAAAAE